MASNFAVQSSNNMCHFGIPKHYIPRPSLAKQERERGAGTGKTAGFHRGGRVWPWSEAQRRQGGQHAPRRLSWYTPMPPFAQAAHTFAGLRSAARKRASGLPPRLLPANLSTRGQARAHGLSTSWLSHSPLLSRKWGWQPKGAAPTARRRQGWKPDGRDCRKAGSMRSTRARRPAKPEWTPRERQTKKNPLCAGQGG